VWSQIVEIRACTLEMVDRERRTIERWIKEAKFPAVKILATFDASNYAVCPTW
jgi:hypothetical protein